jgi:hypothetical protein
MYASKLTGTHGSLLVNLVNIRLSIALAVKDENRLLLFLRRINTIRIIRSLSQIQMERIMDNKTDTLDMTADIVSAFVGNNSAPASELPSLIQSVYAVLNGISTGESAAKVEAPKEPAVSI